jgi:hypothetical protein
LKLTELQVGGRYSAKVSGRIALVKIVDIKQTPGSSGTNRGSPRTLIIAVNETTGRRITIRSPQRLRNVEGCEFCLQPYNRPATGFVCPYCGKHWPAHAS